MYRRTDKEEKASSNKDEKTAVTEDMEVDDEIQTVHATVHVNSHTMLNIYLLRHYMHCHFTYLISTHCTICKVLKKSFQCTTH